MKILLRTSIVFAALNSLAADVVYREKPVEDPIRVESGSASIFAQDLFGKKALAARWTFDDVSDVLHNDVAGGPVLEGGSIESADSEAVGSLSAAADVIRGGGSVGIDKSECGLRLRSVPDFLKGEDPYTISFWVRITDQVQMSGSNPVGCVFYLGNDERSHNDSSTTNCVAIQLYSPTTAYVGNLKSGAGRAGITLSENVVGKWHHVAIAYTPPANPSDSEATGGYRFYFDDKKSGATYRLRKEAVNVCCFGMGRNSTGGRVLCKNAGTEKTAFDEILVFKKTLTDEEVAYVREFSTPPADFLANWEVAEDGTLSLWGGVPQDVRGSGALVVETDAVLSPAREACWSGTVSAEKVVVDGDAGKPFVLAGAVSHAERIDVRNGSLVVSPSAVRVPEALKDNLVAYWTFDDPDDVGRDLSGRGNDLVLVHEGGLPVSAVESCVPGFGKMLDFPGGAEGAKNYYQSKTSPLNGLEIVDYQNTKGASVTISAWVKLDAADSATRSGFFSFSNAGCGTRLDAPNALYFGDNGKLLRANLNGGTLTDGKCHHIVLVGNPAKADATDGTSNEYFRLYVDGLLAGQTANFAKSMCDGYFQLAGSTQSTGRGLLDGQIDEVAVFNTPLTAADVESLYAMREGSIPKACTAALPQTSEVVVNGGASLRFDNANETVAALAGSGNLALSARSRLVVTTGVSFTGIVDGDGELAFGEEMTFDVGGVVQTGVDYRFVTAQAGVLKMPADLSGWTVKGAEGDRVKFRVCENGDGTETIVARVIANGLLLIFR